MNCDLKIRVLVMNPRYIFAVSCHTLIHGGLGHLSPCKEELILVGFIWIIVIRSLPHRKLTQIWANLSFWMLLQIWMRSTIYSLCILSQANSSARHFSLRTLVTIFYQSHIKITSIFSMPWETRRETRHFRPDYPAAGRTIRLQIG